MIKCSTYIIRGCKLEQSPLNQKKKKRSMNIWPCKEGTQIIVLVGCLMAEIFLRTIQQYTGHTIRCI
jgi:hypothetical protein